MLLRLVTVVSVHVVVLLNSFFSVKAGLSKGSWRSLCRFSLPLDESRPDVIILGASLTGLALAKGLHDAGFSVEIISPENFRNFLGGIRWDRLFASVSDRQTEELQPVCNDTLKIFRKIAGDRAGDRLEEAVLGPSEAYRACVWEMKRLLLFELVHSGVILTGNSRVQTVALTEDDRVCLRFEKLGGERSLLGENREDREVDLIVCAEADPDAAVDLRKLLAQTAEDFRKGRRGLPPKESASEGPEMGHGSASIEQKERGGEDQGPPPCSFPLRKSLVFCVSDADLRGSVLRSLGTACALSDALTSSVATLSSRSRAIPESSAPSQAEKPPPAPTKPQWVQLLLWVDDWLFRNKNEQDRIDAAVWALRVKRRRRMLSRLRRYDRQHPFRRVRRAVKKNAKSKKVAQTLT